MLARRTLLGLLAGALLALAGRTAGAADDKKDDEKSGTVVGIVTAKGENWIEVKADGEEKGRKYFPHWVGGLPKDGGGPDKKTVERIKEVTVGSRIKLDWKFAERPRVEKIEVLKAARKETDKK